MTIGSDGQIVVTFTLTDANGIPITPVLASTTDPNQARTRFAIAHIENYSGGGELNSPFSKYVNDVNATRPAYDSGGTLGTVDAAEGIYSYTFKTKLPQGFDPALTYNVGMQVDRTYQDQQLSANPVYASVPAGGTPEALLDVTTQQCNSCHQPLIAHGNRREVALCVLCHTEAAVDAKGTTIDFRNMIHKIHAGVELPSIVAGPPGSTYQICGSRGCDVFAQKDANGMITGVGLPAPPRGVPDLPRRGTDGVVLQGPAGGRGLRNLPRRREPVAVHNGGRTARDQPLPEPWLSRRRLHLLPRP